MITAFFKREYSGDSSSIVWAKDPTIGNRMINAVSLGLPDRLPDFKSKGGFH